MDAFIPFELEEWQSHWETTVTYNLADSGVKSLSLRELLDGGDPAQVSALLDLELYYPPVSGTYELRSLIASQYPGADAENVLVTVGAAEANQLVVNTLVGPGDRAVVMEPGYRQVWGSCLNRGANVEPFRLRADRNWRPDLDELVDTLRSPTALMAITNPNNPVGTILTSEEMDAVVRAASEAGTWLLADEVYRGTERVGDVETPSFWGRYERLIAVGSLSKAFGLPGLRLGWLVGPEKLIDAAWRRHEYATIAASTISMSIGERALAAPNRDRLLNRTRRFIREGYGQLAEWIEASDGILSCHPPEATPLAFVRYNIDIPSIELADLLRRHGDVLVAPGIFFGVENHLRITHGLERGHLGDALNRISDVLGTWRKARNPVP